MWWSSVSPSAILQDVQLWHKVSDQSHAQQQKLNVSNCRHKSSLLQVSPDNDCIGKGLNCYIFSLLVLTSISLVRVFATTVHERSYV